MGQNIIYCGLGRILENMSNWKAGVDFQVTVVISDCEDNSLKQTEYRNILSDFQFIERVVFRPNQGCDIGSYNLGLQLLREDVYPGDLLFLNSSLAGPRRDNWLLDYKQLFHSQPGIGLCGIGMNNLKREVNAPSYLPVKPHVQSFFLYTSMEVMDHVFPGNLPGANLSGRKEDLITKGEIEISSQVLANNLALCCLPYPRFIYRTGDQWTIPHSLGYRWKPEFTDRINTI